MDSNTIVGESCCVLPSPSNKSFQPPRQPLTAGFARIYHLLSCQSEQFRDARIFKRQVVPYFGETLGADLQRISKLPDCGNASRGKKRYATKSGGVFEIEQQRRALIYRKLLQLFPQPLKEDALLDAPRLIGLGRG